MTLAETMKDIATDAASRIRDEAQRAAEQEQAARERRIEAGAQAFFDKRLEYLEDLIYGEAAAGRFEYKVWTVHRGDSERHLAEERGLKAIRKWLEEEGFQTEWRVTDDEVIDYGRINHVELFARWS